MDTQTELHQRLCQIGAHVELAAAANAGTAAAPPELRTCVERLRERCDHAKRQYLAGGDDAPLAASLGEIEAIAERAAGLAAMRPNRREVLASTLDEAWREIRDLRRQLERGRDAG